MPSHVPLGVLGQMASNLGWRLPNLQGEAGAETDERNQAGNAYQKLNQALIWWQDTNEIEVRISVLSSNEVR